MTAQPPGGSGDETIAVPRPPVPGALPVVGAPPAVGAQPASPQPPPRPAPNQPGSGDLNQTLRDTSVWTDELVAQSGIPVVDVPLVTVGGGVGSFVLADHLRIAGVPTSQIRVMTTLASPFDQYRYLATNSQVPDHERIRSDSVSTPDNIWGFPSYAVREAWERKTFRPILGLATEPVLAEYYTPKAEQVYRTTAKEAARIGWSDMLVRGRARMVRRRIGGGYFTILTPPAESGGPKRVAYRSRWVHLAVGYPGVKFLPDLQEYRQKSNDFVRVVNAYEPHEHIYQSLLGNGGDVVVRGSGIVASRVLQRLLDDVERQGARTRVWHLFRNYRSGPSGPPKFRREAADGWTYQAFNYSKAAWGGQLREQLLQLHGPERAEFIKAMGGTNTAKRKTWVDQLARNRATGVYQVAVGVVRDVQPGPDRRIVTTIRNAEGHDFAIPADFIIDATGLEGDVRESQILDDLMTHGGAEPNPLGRLDISPTFEINHTRSDPGRLYASGSMTLGGPFAPADSFLGLQLAGLEITDDLNRQGFGARLGPGRSTSQWLKWARGKAP